MMNNLQLMKCESCGGEDLKNITEGSTTGLVCGTCGWSVMTTYIPECELDMNQYTVNVSNANYKNSEHIKLISAIANLNFLETKNLLNNKNPIIFNGSAKSVMEIREKLEKAKIDFSISPIFPW